MILIGKIIGFHKVIGKIIGFHKYIIANARKKVVKSVLAIVRFVNYE